MKTNTFSLLLFALLACFSVSPMAQAVVPPPDGGYPAFNTAEGQNALFGLTSGVANTAIGWFSLKSDTDGSLNTAVGAGTLALNVGDQNTGEGTQNTAIGTAALLFNTAGMGNTATGCFALYFNDMTGSGFGSGNCAFGNYALYSNTDGYSNTAVGSSALAGNTTGFENTGVGGAALYFNSDGSDNTAVGGEALWHNSGSFNTAIGHSALGNNAGDDNTAIGVQALASNSGLQNTAIGEAALAVNTSGISNTAVGLGALSNNSTGSGNTAVGILAGFGISTANNVICIGADGLDVSDTTWIGNVYGVTTINGTTAPVVVSADGQLGTVASSERFKNDIATMDKASEAILSLRPVTFHYKTDAKDTPQFGLIAEEVAKVNPALVLPDKEGKPYSVRYDAVNAMLLNEFLKEHRRVEQLENDFQAIVARQQKQIEALSVGLQKVSAQLELNKGALRTVLNSR